MKQLRYRIDLDGKPVVGDDILHLQVSGVVDQIPGHPQNVLLALAAAALAAKKAANPELLEVTAARVTVTWVDVPEKPPTSNLEH